jgi:hypothetical protein
VWHSCTINPQLNSHTGIRTRGGRNDIADVIMKVMIPHTQKYTLPEDTHINLKAQERMLYKRGVWPKGHFKKNRHIMFLIIFLLLFFLKIFCYSICFK